MAWDKFRTPGQGCPATISRPAKQKHRKLLQRRGQAVGPGRRVGLTWHPSVQAVVSPTAQALRGGAASGRGRRRPHHMTKDLPSFPRPVTSSCLLSPRVLGPLVPSSSPGLICKTLTLAADGAQSSARQGGGDT